MSNRYEASSNTTAAVAANGPYFELRNTAARRMYVEEVGFFIGAATASRIALARATAQGTGGTLNMTGLAEDPNAPAAAGILATPAFTAAPTVGAVTTYLRRANLPAAIGAGVIWTWPQSDRLVVPPSGSLLMVGLAAGSLTADFYVVWTE